jgi:predicted ATP-dependent protease
MQEEGLKILPFRRREGDRTFRQGSIQTGKLTLKLEKCWTRASPHTGQFGRRRLVEREHVTGDRRGHIPFNMLEEKIRQAIDEGIIMVDVKGEVAGQINGLSVLSLVGYAFGRPSRITARTYMGHAGMVNIEREVKMSGPIHDKGVMILTGFLGQRYATDKP